MNHEDDIPEPPVLIYPKGARIVLETGSYSSTITDGVYSCLKECDLPKLVKEYLTYCNLPVPDKNAVPNGWAEIRSHRAEGHNLGGFSAWMIKNGYWDSEDHQILNIGDFYFSDTLLR